MAQLTDTLLQQMVDAIVVEVNPEQVILFWVTSTRRFTPRV